MGISKVIFFLHCTGLALLSSCVFAGSYNSDICNHTAIRLDYQHLLEKIINRELDTPCTENIISCCPPTKLENRTSATSLLACIHAFTAKCTAHHFEFTETLLDLHCDANPAKNGTQNVEVLFWKSEKCLNQRQGKNKCGSKPLCELKKMWKHYMWSLTNMDMKP